jgi:hypothetical protein
LSDDPLAEWKRQIANRQDLVTDPDGHRQKLVDLAMLSHRRRQVGPDELSEMLELSDAARLWGLVELEEAYAIGLFPSEGTAFDEGMTIIKGKG